MKKIILTCFLALPCLFQKAIIKLQAINERLGLTCPPTALRCIESLTYLAAGVLHVAQRSISRGAYLSSALSREALFHRPQGGIFRTAYLYKKATWIGIYFLIPILLCSSISPTLSKSAQSPPEPSIHRSAVQVSPHSGDTHRGGLSRPDTFTQLDNPAETSVEAIYTTDVSAIDGGPALRSGVSHLPATSKLNFGLVDPDQDMGAGEGIADSQPAPFPVLSNQINSGREAYSQSTEAKSLASCVLCLASKNSSSFPVFSTHNNSGQKALHKGTKAQSLVSNVLCLESRNGLVDSDQDMGAGEGTSSLQPAPVTVFLVHRIPESAGNLVVDLWDAKMYGLENFDNHQRMEIAPMKPHMLTGLMPREERAYRFRTPTISGASIMNFSFGDDILLRDYIVSPGDSVMIQVNPRTSTITFSGPSAYKFRLQKELQELLSTSFQETDVVLPFNTQDRYAKFLEDPKNQTAWDTISSSFGRKTFPVVAGRSELDFIKSIPYQKWEAEVNRRVEYYQNWISEPDILAFKAGTLGRLGNIHVGRLQGAFNRAIQLSEPKLEEEVEAYISQFTGEFAKDIPIAIALKVPSFRNFLLSKSKLNADLNDRSFLEQVQEEYPTAVADRLAIQFLSDYRRKIPDFESQANELLSRIVDPSLKAELENMLSKFGMGSKVISFDWLGIDGKRIQTAEFKDKVVLMDFWISGCGACKAFHEKILSPLISKYADHPKVEIISVSGDRKPDYWLKQKGTLYVPETGYTPAYAEQKDGENPFLSHYNIQSFPQWMIIRVGGSLLNLGRVPATLEEAERLIEKALSKSADPSISL